MIVNTKAAPSKILQAINGFLSALTGGGPDRGNLARSCHLAVGVAALSDIKADFIRKSSGQTGEDGVTWAPLTPEYLAYQRRFGKGEKAALKKAAGVPRGGMFSPKPVKPEYGKELPMRAGLLTKSQTENWWDYYFEAKHRFLMSGYGLTAAKRAAAQVAWARVKAEGGKTFLGVYGNRKVDILRDTGVLLNSLSPGVFDGSNYQKPSGRGGSQQVMKNVDDGVIVGTNVAYAGCHQNGKGRSHRPFLPENPPQVWLDRWKAVGNQAIAVALRLAVERAA